MIKNIDDKGFSLLEVMIALAIIAIGFTAILKLQASSLDMADEASQIQQAKNLAENLLFSLILSGEIEIGETKGEFQDEPGYSYRRLILPSLLPNILEVRIEILWNRGLKERKLEMVYYLFI